MAGLATVRGGPPLSQPPLLSLSKPPTSSLLFLSLSSSSFDSAFFGYRLCFATFKFRSLSLSSSPTRLAVSARFGGKRSNDDQALGLSAVRSDKVRLIDEQQNMVGIMLKLDAIQRAEDAELDLVVLSPDADPPVVRIMNYDKYRYEQQKKKREQQKKSLASRMDLKELKMGYNIDVHDYSVRLKAAQKFLKDGDKVKVIVNLKGRGNVFLTKAIELIRRFQNDLGELATEEGNNFSKRTREEITERHIFMILLPNKTALQKSQEAPKKAASAAPASIEVSSAFSVLRELL